MARFYQTARPTFVEDIIYQPPWEMMNTALQNQQKQYDNAITQTSALNDLLKIEHINDEVENERVNAKKDYYENKINDLANSIKSSGDYRKILPQIRGLQKEIEVDRSTGDIAAFESSASTQRKFLEDINKASKDKDGDVAHLQGLYKSYMDQWKGQENRSLDSSLGYEAAIRKPEELIGKNIVDIAKKVPGFSEESFIENSNGNYIIGTGANKKYLTKEQLAETIRPYILSNPSVMSYVDQIQRAGLISDPNDYINNLIGLGTSLDYEESKIQKKLKADLYGLKNYDYALKQKEKENEKAAAIIASSEEKVYTPEEISSMNVQRKNLELKNQEGTITPEEESKLFQYRAIFDKAGESLGDDILKAKGYTPEKIEELKASGQASAMVQEAFGDLLSLDDPNWGYKDIPNGYYSDIVSKRGFRTEDRKQAEKLKSALEKSGVDLTKKMSESLIINTPVTPVNNLSGTGEALTNYLDLIISSQVKPQVYDSSFTLNDINGKRRDTKRIDIDTGFWSGTGKTDDPLRSIMDITRTNSIGDLVGKGYGNINYTKSGGTDVWKFIPNEKALKSAGIDVTDSKFDGFTLTWDNIDSKILESLPEKDRATLMKIFKNNDSQFQSINQKVDTAEAHLKDGRNFIFSIKDNIYNTQIEDGKYIIKTVPKGQTNWNNSKKVAFDSLDDAKTFLYTINTK